MAITNIQLITDALLEIGVINESETPSAEQGEHALRKANQLFDEAEEIDGIHIGWCEQTATGDDAPIYSWAERWATLRLALALCPSYGGGASLSEIGAREFADADAAVKKKSALKNIRVKDTSNMSRAEGGFGGSRILTDR